LGIFAEIIEEYKDLKELLISCRFLLKQLIMDLVKIDDIKTFHEKFIDLIRLDIEI
jgi:hypothetical protein